MDELGGLSKAIELAKSLAGIGRDEEPRLVVWPKKKGFWSTVFGRRSAGIASGRLPFADEAVRALRIMEKTRVWAVCPLGMDVPALNVP